MSVFNSDDDLPDVSRYDEIVRQNRLRREARVKAKKTADDIVIYTLSGSSVGLILAIILMFIFS